MSKTPPPRDLEFPTFQCLNCLIKPTPYTPYTPSTFYFLAVVNNEHVHSTSVIWGQKPRLCAISSSPPPTASTVGSTPPYTLPTPPPHFISSSRSIMSTYTPYPSLRVKTLPPHDLKFPTSHRLNCQINTTLYTPYTPSAFHFLVMVNNERVHSISVIWGQKSCLCAISSFLPPTTSTVGSISPYALPTPPLHFISSSRSITSMYAPYPSFRIKTPPLPLLSSLVPYIPTYVV